MNNNVLPDSPLLDCDGNIFALPRVASRTLKEHGLSEESTEMAQRVTSFSNYHEALGIICTYVNPVIYEQDNNLSLE